jgi:hypothetical protein
MISGVVIISSCAESIKNSDVSSSTMNEQRRRTASQPSELADLDAQAGVEQQRLIRSH